MEANSVTKFRTLIVDDTLFIRRLLSQILKQTEFEVVGEAADGAEAIAKYHELAPDFVLMDIMMPGLDGINAVRQIKQAYPGARIVMCSALGQEHLVMEALNAGALDFIVKPFAPENVLRTLRNLAGHDQGAASPPTPA